MPLDLDEYSETSLRNMEDRSSNSRAGVSNSATRPANHAKARKEISRGERAYTIQSNSIETRISETATSHHEQMVNPHIPFFSSHEHDNFAITRFLGRAEELRRYIKRTVTEDQNEVTVDNCRNTMSNCTDGAVLKLCSDYLLDQVVCG